MSNALALASVTFTIMDLLNNGLIDRDISASLGDVAVTALPPDRVDLANLSRSQLNLFLYQVTPNQGWRNAGLPSRNTAGERINDNPLALDLHYLLTAYGADQFHAEILLGYGMQLLHETPVLTRNAIRRSLAGPSQVNPGGGLPDALRNLFTSQLSEQVEMIKIWPQTITTEEISRMWTAFQARYRPTAAYQASVVLIESHASAKSALPVQSRSVRAIPFQKPSIEQVLSRATASDPAVPDRAIVSGDQLVLQGTQLKGDDTVVALSDTELVPAVNDISMDQIAVTIPAAIPAGIQPVQVLQRLLMGSPPMPHRVIESNVESFTLRPQIQGPVTISDPQGGGPSLRSGNINLNVKPAVGFDQRVKVLLNHIAPISSPPPVSVSAFSFEAPPRMDLSSPPASPPPPTMNLKIPFAGVPAGDYLVRVVVDGAESPLQTDPGGVFNAPQVTIL